MFCLAFAQIQGPAMQTMRPSSHLFVNPELTTSSSSYCTITSSMDSSTRSESFPGAVQPQRVSPEESICNTFWRPRLTFHSFQHGRSLVDFGSLWPDGDHLRILVGEIHTNTSLQGAVLYLCKLVLRCGPVRVLKALVEQKIIGPDQRFEPLGGTMMHLACVAQNPEAVSYLTSVGVNLKAQDRNGRTADQVCYCPRTRKILQPFKSAMQAVAQPSPRKKSVAYVSVQQKQDIFSLAEEGHYDELQIKLQTMEFEVNNEKSAEGDLLIHIAAAGGVDQLDLLMTLVCIQGADVNAYNGKGQTPLCIAADLGHAITVEVLICILGADPNKCDLVRGWTPLHYAASHNYMDIVSCLLKRGADVNLESYNGLRPDDVAKRYEAADCTEIIGSKRTERCRYYRHLVQEGQLLGKELTRRDLFVTDMTGSTLLMVGAENNRVENMLVLLGMEDCPIDAQHERSGCTALAIAAREGHAEAVRTLLEHGANPSIPDVEGLLPLHHACRNRCFIVVEIISHYRQGLTGLEQALKLATTPEIQSTVRYAIDRRQSELITPLLFECAINGDADRLFCTLESGDEVNQTTGAGDWPMYLAAENGHLDVMKILYERDGDISRLHKASKNTVLHVACIRGHLHVAKYVLQFCRKTPGGSPALLDVNAVNAAGLTALQLAAEKGYSRIVRLLLQNGATTALLDSYGELFSCPQYQGVQMLIETHRKQHLDRILECLEHRDLLEDAGKLFSMPEKHTHASGLVFLETVFQDFWRKLQRIMDTLRNKKGLPQLKTIWQPPFDHNMRSQDGDTPLMVACSQGNLEVVKFLLESAVYEDSGLSDMDSSLFEDDLSDADSGTCVEDSTPVGASASTVTASDTTAVKERYSSPQFHHTGEKELPQLPFAAESSPSHESRRQSRTSVSSRSTARRSLFSVQEKDHDSAVTEPTTDTASFTFTPSKSKSSSSRLKGSLSIYLDGNKVSHVCAVNPRDGCTALHRSIESKQCKPELVQALLESDSSCINLQDDTGCTALHLACRLGHKPIVKLLMSNQHVDLNMRTLEGHLPEEMTKTTLIQKMVEKARADAPNSSMMILLDTSASSGGGASIDFDSLNLRFERLKKEL
ncbi:PREDICTED: serine/threonine-protein phosphatase 6 regulatory ankyrin repeat subunit B-like [Branchiostoma belcheri]|uniref:Serine/threonine-protein phosphatase 6 regulatory ankyrin repeat subunit B-like n=1 Tax=Branchiostoma belcheri TaxID=7741 RepID=A0A6P4ZTS0_BRABE|nr:PREDICTED: serine/threonine-protein phosphatase 6 regulatory ankyrin repeat subunit B-like [Branchiostoma belcheri]